MKIEHRLQTEVSRFVTVNDALCALNSNKNAKLRTAAKRLDVVSGLMHGTFKTAAPSIQADSRGEAAIANIRRLVLSREFEGFAPYELTCAHLSLEREWGISELWHALEKQDYRPAGMNESVAYLKLLIASGVPVGTIFHLGTHIVNEWCQEQKLLVFDDGRLELVNVYARTVVRAHWHVVVARKEKKAPTASVAFGRKK